MNQTHLDTSLVVVGQDVQERDHERAVLAYFCTGILQNKGCQVPPECKECALLFIIPDPCLIEVRRFGHGVRTQFAFEVIANPNPPRSREFRHARL